MSQPTVASRLVTLLQRHPGGLWACDICMMLGIKREHLSYAVTGARKLLRKVRCREQDRKTIDADAVAGQSYLYGFLYTIAPDWVEGGDINRQPVLPMEGCHD